MMYDFRCMIYDFENHLTIYNTIIQKIKSMSSYIHPNQDQSATIKDLPIDKPIVMINLCELSVKIKGRCNYAI